MPRHVVAKAEDIPPGTRKLVHVAGRDIVILNVRGELFALSDKCPHKGGSLSRGKLTGLVVSDEPGTYEYSRAGEILRCPWHGWEFDVRTGRSWCDPARLRLMIGGMVESTLAMTTSACFAAGQGGFQFVDLDTPLLMTENPFDGGMIYESARIDLSQIAAGHGVTPKA